MALPEPGVVRSHADTGLSDAEAAHLLAVHGPNEMPTGPRVGVWSRIATALREPFNLVLLAAGALTLLTRDWSDAIVIGVVVLLNSAIGVAQEIRADRAITALSSLTAPTVRVRRRAVQMSIPSRDLVPGDIVLLSEGDVVPADARLLEEWGLLVDESALTGESVAVEHRASSADHAGDDLLAGTVVVKGRAVAEVVRTGGQSALGQIAALLDRSPPQTPLQRRMASLSRTLAVIAIALSALVMVLGLARGQNLEPMLLTAVSLTVAAIPESLPAVVTLALALGAHRMAARSAIVRRLPAVETLGSVSVLATDKTGTLTGGRMVVGELWTPLRTVTMPGEGSVDHSDSLPRGQSECQDVVDLLTAAALCNDAELDARDSHTGVWTAHGDPTEVALVLAAARAGLTRHELELKHPRVAERPFDSAAKTMTTAHRDGPADGAALVIIKGSPEVMRANHASGQFAHTWERTEHTAADMAARGYRVLAVAAGAAHPDNPTVGCNMRLLGLIGISDPATPAARTTIADCRRAGITPVLITGDHPDTAAAIARDVGILPPDGGRERGVVVTGEQMADGSVADLTVPRVFARTSPAQKLDIIEAWQRHGASIAMTGDGVNDGPALRRADVGVAMGHRGTEVARQAADLVLADDDLETVVSAVEEGRRVYDNIRRFLVFGLSGGAAEIGVMLLGPLLGLTVPLTAAQILWINLLTHGVTGVAIGAEPVSPGTMSRRPRPPEESVLGSGLWRSVLLCAVVITVSALAVGMWAAATARPWQSMVFLTLTSLQLGVVLALRPVLLTRRNPFLPVAVTASLGLAIAGIYSPVLQSLLGTQALMPADALAAIGVGAVGWAAAFIMRAREPG